MGKDLYDVSKLISQHQKYRGHVQRLCPYSAVLQLFRRIHSVSARETVMDRYAVSPV